MTAPSTYVSTIPQSCFNDPVFANCMAAQYVIASSACEKQGTLTDECVGKYADSLASSACGCPKPTPPTFAEQVKQKAAAIPGWGWVLIVGGVSYLLMGDNMKRKN